MKTVALQVLPAIKLHSLKDACAQCNARELCLPLGLSDTELQQLDDVVGNRQKLKRGEHLYRNGDPFSAIYAIKTGFFKTDVVTEDGRDHVTGFQMHGEILGMDGISGDAHACNAVALEDSEVCVIPFAELEHLSASVPTLQRHFHRVMSREIVRDHGIMMLLGTLRAEERLVAFLLNLSQRYAARGYSATEFHLRATRDEIGSYLGLKLETVSRALSQLQDSELIQVQQKYIRITSLDGLKKMLAHTQTC
ncbi:MAG: fumarate/nitrate reduction transcriptional regulator Fnr [Rhodocyclaceae bacterium]|nr:fumarate/nitrate reduction transcriptional regulator Fnr [Rhodocyclaceae bacterium]